VKTLSKFKYMLMNFMSGRYGPDELYNFFFVLYFVLFVINIFVRSPIISLLMLFLLIYSFFRVFSRNLSARQRERAKYLLLKNKVTKKFRQTKERRRDKTHVYKNCPHCKATIRFPRKKGKHSAVCPRCKKDFKVRVWF